MEVSMLLVLGDRLCSNFQGRERTQMEVSMLLVLVDGFRMASLDPNENNMKILQDKVRGRGDVQRFVELGKQEPLRLCWITRQEQLNHPSIHPSRSSSKQQTEQQPIYTY
jgi:hypothetical protein